MKLIHSVREREREKGKLNENKTEHERKLAFVGETSIAFMFKSFLVFFLFNLSVVDPDNQIVFWQQTLPEVLDSELQAHNELSGSHCQLHLHLPCLALPTCGRIQGAGGVGS